MITNAIILAAGQGKRLNGVSDEKPKGFISVGGETLIERSLRILEKHGITNILIVTGYSREYYETLAEKYDCVTTINNPSFASSGSMYSYYCARDQLDSDVLLLESDLIYEERAIDALLKSDKDSAILVSGMSNASDEVFIETNGGFLVNMSKNPDVLESIEGEMVGISKISYPLYREMIRTCDDLFKDGLNADYESCLVQTAKRRPISCLKIGDLVWGEIDNLFHLDRIEKQIYPRLLTLETVAKTV